MTDKQNKGLYNKYMVQRVDGNDQPGCKHENCDYFVIDVVHDAYAKAALLAYADACEADYPHLANDIRARFATANN
jgi:hypothetical protein